MMQTETTPTSIDLSEYYSENYKHLYHVSYSIIRDKHQAEDIVQDTFLKAIQKIDTVENTDKIPAWLSIIARRLAIDYIRRERKNKGILMEQEAMDSLGKDSRCNVEEEVENLLFQEQMNTAMEMLAREYRDVLWLKVNHELKEKEIATVLHITSSNVKTRIHRARKQLKLLVQ